MIENEFNRLKENYQNVASKLDKIACYYAWGAVATHDFKSRGSPVPKKLKKKKKKLNLHTRVYTEKVNANVYMYAYENIRKRNCRIADTVV